MASEIYNIHDKPKSTRGMITSSRKYVAFKAADREVYRLKVRFRSEAWQRVPYSCLLRILENSYGTELGLLFTFGAIEIYGYNLDVVTDAIDRHSCDFIQEFDEKLWDKPTDPKAPFIENIKITIIKKENMGKFLVKPPRQKKIKTMSVISKKSQYD